MPDVVSDVVLNVELGLIALLMVTVVACNIVRVVVIVVVKVTGVVLSASTMNGSNSAVARVRKRILTADQD